MIPFLVLTNDYGVTQQVQTLRAPMAGGSERVRDEAEEEGVGGSSGGKSKGRGGGREQQRSYTHQTHL